MEGRKRCQRREHNLLVPDSLPIQLQYRRDSRCQWEPDSPSMQLREASLPESDNLSMQQYRRDIRCQWEPGSLTVQLQYRRAREVSLPESGSLPMQP